MEEEKDIFAEFAKVKTEAPKVEKENNVSDLYEEEEGTLTVDVYDDDDEFVVQATIAGVDEDDIMVDISPTEITIKGERKKEKEISEDKYLYQELFWGKFSRSIILPEEVNPEESSASLSKGILTVRMPKLHKLRKVKQLKIKSSD